MHECSNHVQHEAQAQGLYVVSQVHYYTALAVYIPLIYVMWDTNNFYTSICPYYGVILWHKGCCHAVMAADI